MPLNKELLEILACPKCKGDLAATPAEDGLLCAACGLAYPVRDEIPIMLVEEAVPLAAWEQGKRSVADLG